MHFHINYRPELVRPTQGATSVIRISPNPRQWASSEQQSVILQHALTSPANQIALETENSQLSTGSKNIYKIGCNSKNCFVFRYTLLCASTIT